MKHLGDITKINGAIAEPVDCLTFGSPCQDLSIAGKRAGLAGERSGLFMEATRIIKEMRSKTNGRYPAFAVWENVVGAFSSNNGEDFRAVLEELARCVEPGAVIPGPVKGKWAKAGCIAGDGWSIAWRTFDSQFWGVPQRRRRIAAVLDLGGQRAGEILFEREGLSGNSAKSIPAWKESARNPQAGTAGYDRLVDGEGAAVSEPVSYLDNYGGQAEYAHDNIDVSSTLGSFQEPIVGHAIPCTVQIRGGCEGGGKGALVQVDKTGALTCMQDKTLFQPVFYSVGGAGVGSMIEEGCGCLTGAHETTISNTGHIVLTKSASYGLDRASFNQGQNAKYDFTILEDQQPTLTARGPGAVLDLIRWIVRRLTPRECERLQGFPDDWTQIGEWYDSKGKLHKEADGPRYKALGNSIALPQWWWLTCKMAPYLPEGSTLASLFDGIGGFPLVWETLHGTGTAIWASEIEEFPIAVTKYHFPEPEEEDWME